MIHLSTSLTYYKREDVQKAMVLHGQDKEVAARFNDKFGKRPDMLAYPGDVLQLAKQGATSFHCSEELWTNPLQLIPQMQKADLDKLRKGWDLLLDIDTDATDSTTRLEYSKIAADLIVKELKKHGIEAVTAKFSGNKGFHIAVPFEAFPKEVNGKETRELFPEAAKRIALYLKEKIKKNLGEQILRHEKGDYNAIAQKTGKEKKDFVYMEHVKGGLESERNYEFNAEPFLVIDTVLISSRHMYRMPYSMHEKSGLVSTPVDVDKILEFSRETAAPEIVKVGKHPFMDRTKAKQDETMSLFVEAYDFAPKTHLIDAKSMPTANYEELDADIGKIPQQYFPACIKKMLEGVSDGRKRALFVLINFLSCCNYGPEETESIIKEWNQKNKEPLPPLYVGGQLSYNRQKNEKVLPPNCSNASYYKELGIECTAECGNCKNPVAEAKWLYRKAMRIEEGQKKQKQPKKKADKPAAEAGQ